MSQIIKFGGMTHYYYKNQLTNYLKGGGDGSNHFPFYNKPTNKKVSSELIPRTKRLYVPIMSFYSTRNNFLALDGHHKSIISLGDGCHMCFPVAWQAPSPTSKNI